MARGTAVAKQPVSSHSGRPSSSCSGSSGRATSGLRNSCGWCPTSSDLSEVCPGNRSRLRAEGGAGYRTTVLVSVSLSTSSPNGYQLFERTSVRDRYKRATYELFVDWQQARDLVEIATDATQSDATPITSTLIPRSGHRASVVTTRSALRLSAVATTRASGSRRRFPCRARNSAACRAISRVAASTDAGRAPRKSSTASPLPGLCRNGATRTSA
jgi:hypothetical protein